MRLRIVLREYSQESACTSRQYNARINSSCYPGPSMDAPAQVEVYHRKKTWLTHIADVNALSRGPLSLFLSLDWMQQKPLVCSLRAFS